MTWEDALLTPNPAWLLVGIGIGILFRDWQIRRRK
jgi:hypothetical protein